MVGDVCPSLPSGRELHLIESKKAQIHFAVSWQFFSFFAIEASAKCNEFSSDAPNHKYALLWMYGEGESTAFKLPLYDVKLKLKAFS